MSWYFEENKKLLKMDHIRTSDHTRMSIEWMRGHGSANINRGTVEGLILFFALRGCRIGAAGGPMELAMKSSIRVDMATCRAQGSGVTGAGGLLWTGSADTMTLSFIDNNPFTLSALALSRSRRKIIILL